MKLISSCVRQMFLKEQSQIFEIFLQSYLTWSSCFSEYWKPLLSMRRQLRCKLLGITANMGMPGIPLGYNCKTFNPCYLWEHIFLFAWLAVGEDERLVCWAVKPCDVSLLLPQAALGKVLVPGQAPLSRRATAVLGVKWWEAGIVWQIQNQQQQLQLLKVQHSDQYC